MAEHDHVNDQLSGENQMPEKEGLRSQAPPPLQLITSSVDPPSDNNTNFGPNFGKTPLQLMEIEQGKGGGFEPFEALGVARNAPSEGEEIGDSGGVFLRSEPDSGDEGNIIRRVPYQDQFFIEAKNSSWYQVRTLSGEEGYVSKHLVSVNGSDTMGFTVHVIQSGETAQGLASGYFNGENGRAEWIPNELDYAKAIWAYNNQHYGEEIGIHQSGEQVYSLAEGVAIWIPSTDWAYRYVKGLGTDEKHGGSWARWAYDFATYDNPVAATVRESLEALANEWDPSHAQAILAVIKGHLKAGRDTMVGVVEKVPVFAQFMVPGGPAVPVFANFSISFLIGALDQAASAPPEVLKQVMKSYLTACIDPEFYIGLIEGAATGIKNWFTDIGDAIAMIGEFVGSVGEMVFSSDTYTEDIPNLVKAISESLPAIGEFLAEINISEIFSALHGSASALGEQLGASAFSMLLEHLGNSPFGQGFSSGKIMGYLIPEIILAVGTEGIGTLLKNSLSGLRVVMKGAKAAGTAAIGMLRRIGPFLDDLIKVALKLIASGKKGASSFGKKFLELLQKLKRIAKGGAKNPLSRYLDGGTGFKNMYYFEKEFGKAGGGNAWHHIVEQHKSNIGRFGAENIHNTKNLVKLPHGKGTIHARITGHYNSLMPGKTIRYRDYIKGLSYDKQYEYGLKIMEKFGFNGPSP